MTTPSKPYTRTQLGAINEIDRNLHIIACAGSGKTEVISARVVEILKRKAGDGIAPRNIVAFTFTDKAAAELKDRISRMVSAEFGAALGLAEMYVGTIHGYCLELLQTYVYEFLKFGVLTGDTAHLIMVEAKGVTAWTNKQATSKARRLEAIFGQRGDTWPHICPHFVIVSPREPEELDCSNWPGWMKRDDGRPYWIRMELPGGLFRVTRCEESGKVNRQGRYWKAVGTH